MPNMSNNNDSMWEGFESNSNSQDDAGWSGFGSEFWGGMSTIDLSETPPASHVQSTIADHRQILNILFMVDVSGSMRGQRIAQVNYALENIFKELRRRDEMNSSIKIGIMEFSETAKWVTEQPVRLEDYVFTQIVAQPWITNYASAFDLLNQKLRREGFLNPNLGEYFAPLILFVTDGEPVDVTEYPKSLQKLHGNGWFKKSAKYAIAVGEEAKNEEIGRLLTAFTGVRENVRYADEGDALCNLIEFITIRASEVQTSMLSQTKGGFEDKPSIFIDPDPSLFSSMFQK